MKRVIERLEYEQSHLTGRIQQVLSAIKEGKNTPNQLELLDSQYHAMELYSKIIDYRIADLKESK